jgi:alpha-1,2-mannosyltransferase
MITYSKKTIFVLLLSLRASAVIHNQIHDCDETFQVLEPVHYLLYDYAFQSWELSSEYALRSYLYAFVFSCIVFPVRVVLLVTGVEHARKKILFYLLRACVAVFTAKSDALVVVEAIRMERRVGAVCLLVMSFSTGFFCAATSLLANTFAMACVSRAVANALAYQNFCSSKSSNNSSNRRSSSKSNKKKKRKEKVSDEEEEEEEEIVEIEEVVIESRAMERACMWCVVAVIVGWPFAGIACVPIGIFSVCIIRMKRTFRAIVVPSLLLMLISTFCDTLFYGGFSNGFLRTKLISSVFNLIKYNVRGTGGSKLYGTENYSFYFRNLFLHFNVAFLLALPAPLLAFFSHVLQNIRQRNKELKKKQTTNITTKLVPWKAMMVCALPFHVALIFFSLMPHKEERFLYIAYGPLALSCGISVAAIFDTFRIFKRIKLPGKENSIFVKGIRRAMSLLAAEFGILLLIVFMLVSASRTYALVSYYGAPIEIYGALPLKPHGWLPDRKLQDEINVCVGDEWYRFPSHFHLPNERYRLRFIKGAFTGALPMYYEGKALHGTAGAPEGLNDKNQEHERQWFLNATERCDFLIESDETKDSEKYFDKDLGWDIVKSLPFLDNSKSSHFLARTLYIPGYSEKRNVYTQYHLKVRTKNLETGELLELS